MDNSSIDETKLTQEFDVLAERAGLAIPAERRAAIFAQFKDLHRMIALLRQPRSEADELASTYRIETILRSL